MTMNAPEAINTTIPIKQAAELLAVIEDFQDQAMCLAQAIEKHLEPIKGFLQSHAREVLGVSAD